MSTEKYIRALLLADKKSRLLKASFDKFHYKELNEAEEATYRMALKIIVEQTGESLVTCNSKFHFETSEGHLDLALKEIKMLYNAYGLKDDSVLTKDAQVLKSDVLAFITEIKNFK